MADKEKKNPEWVEELNSFLEEFKNKYPEAKVNILAGDGVGYMCAIEDLDVWAGGLFNVLLDTPMLMVPTIDAIQHAYEKVKGAVDNARSSVQPVIIRPNQVKS